MRMQVALIAVVGLVGLLYAGPAAASHDPSGAPFDEDFAVGSASTKVSLLDCCLVDLDAHSDPAGGSPSGVASMHERAFFNGGPVTCLNVTGNRAVVGGAGYMFEVEDNAATGMPDRFSEPPGFFSGTPTICPPDLDVPLRAVTSGDLVVHDAPRGPTSKYQCKNGGWKTFGVFENQGDCVRFVRHRARQECIFIRAAVGRPAFRAEFGSGVHKRHAMRRCVRERMND